MNEPSSIIPGPNSAELVESIIRRRRSTRHFTDASAAHEDLLKLVEAGINAPSGTNTQNQYFLVLTDPNEIRALDKLRFVWPYKSYNKRKNSKNRTGIISNAPAVIIVFADSSRNAISGSGEFHIWKSLDTQNASASIQNMLILATAMGLGTCWVSATEEMNYSRLLSGKTWRDALSGYDIPPQFHIQGLVLVGYAKKVDEHGYPVGERMHGFDWKPTERKPIEDYLIKRGSASSKAKLGAVTRLGLLSLTWGIRTLLFIVRRLDQIVHLIEMRRLRTRSEDSRR